MTTRRTPGTQPVVKSPAHAKKRQRAESGERNGATQTEGLRLPALSEQRRIVALLDASFERLDAIAAAVTELARQLHGPEAGVITADAAKGALLSKAFDGLVQGEAQVGVAKASVRTEKIGTRAKKAVPSIRGRAAR